MGSVTDLHDIWDKSEWRHASVSAFLLLLSYNIFEILAYVLSFTELWSLKEKESCVGYHELSLWPTAHTQQQQQKKIAEMVQRYFN